MEPLKKEQKEQLNKLFNKAENILEVFKKLQETDLFSLPLEFSKDSYEKEEILELKQKYLIGLMNIQKTIVNLQIFITLIKLQNLIPKKQNKNEKNTD